MLRINGVAIILILLPCLLGAQQSQDSKLRQYSLKYGISIQIPKHWEIIENRIMDQIDTNTEIVTGTPQGDNEILIAANYYGQDPKYASATVRLSVRHKQTIDQDQLEAMTNDDIELAAKIGKTSIENALKKTDSSILVTEYKMSKKKLKSFFCFETIYSLNNDKKQILYVIPLCDRRIKLHLSYKISKERYLKPTIMQIINSFAIEATSQSPTQKIYENRQFRFSITPPPGWEKQESPPSQTEKVVKFIDESGTLTVAARPAQDFHKKIINLISEYDLSEQQLADLAHNMYGNTPGVIDPTLVITYLSSQRALGSFYAYEHRSLGAIIYMVLFKAETIRGDIFYKVEMTGPPAKTLEKASELFSKSSKLLQEHMRTFTFLPGKPQ